MTLSAEAASVGDASAADAGAGAGCDSPLCALSSYFDSVKEVRACVCVSCVCVRLLVFDPVSAVVGRGARAPLALLRCTHARGLL